jgi:hypothetical protein
MRSNSYRFSFRRNPFRCTSQSTKSPELKFRALLADGTREVRFERVVANRMLRLPEASCVFT